VPDEVPPVAGDGTTGAVPGQGASAPSGISPSTAHKANRYRNNGRLKLRHRGHRGARAWFTGVILAALVIAVIVVSSVVGQYEASAKDVFGAIWRIVFQGADPLENPSDAALWTIRFPRVALSLLVGAALAMAGTVMQGVFANPLAEPSVIGVSSGASVGACIAIIFGFSATAAWTLPTFAFVAAMVVTFIIWALSRVSGRAVVLTLVLTGIAINAIAGAATSFLIFLGDTTSREQVIFWQMGTLSNAVWNHVAIVAPVFVVGLVGCMLFSGRLDVLALGDQSAAASGINVERLRIVAIVLVCVLTGAAVAFAGIISFVGLIVPHALRLIVGPSHRYLVPLSALGGAVLLGAADIAARTVIPFADLPVGIFTAVVGGPLFLLLLRRTLKRSGVGA
jgi:iron complex transport system permease protein